MAKVLQTLTVNLEANTATFSDAMTKASQISLSSAKSIQKSFMLVSGAAIAAGTAVAGALAVIVVKATEYASSIELMAQKTGVSTQELSKLSYASTLTGGNLDDLGGMLVKFNKSAAESAEGNAKAKAAFAGLGVSVTDSSGRFRQSGAVLEDTIKKLSGMPDGLKKTELEMQVFGRSGAALAPILKVLGDNAAQTASDMKTFGLTMSSETAEGAEHLSQTYERAKLAFTGFGLTIFTTALPALQGLADKVISLAQDGSLQRWATTLGNVVTTGAHAASDAIQFLSDHGQTLKHTIEALIALEVASWLLSINTSALTAAGGIDVLVSSVGKALLKMSGLSGLATAASAAIVSIRGTVTALVSLASTEGIVATATYAMQTAWESFSAAVLANPLTIVVLGIAGGLYILHKAMSDDITAAERLGGVAITWHDQWQAAIDSTKERLSALKTLLLDMNPEHLRDNLDRFNNLPTFGNRAEANAKARTATAATATTSTPPDVAPQPKPTPGPAKPDPYKAELAKLNQELTNSQLALNAAMQNSVDAQRAATEAGKAALIVTELQTKLKRELNTTEKNAITSAIVGAGENEPNTSVVESLRQRTDAAKDALATTQALFLVIGQGAAADDAAKRTVDAATLSRELGASASAKYSVALTELFRVQAQAAKEGRELSAAHEASDLRQGASDADALAYATLQGADALEKMNLALKVNAAERVHAGDDVAVTKELTDAITRQYEAEQRLRAIQQGQAYTSPLAQYHKALEGITKASQDAKDAGVQVDMKQVWLANREAAQHYQEQLEKLHSVYGSAADGARDFFTDLASQSLSAASIVHDSLTQAFDGVNENLTKLLTGQKTACKSFVQSMATSVIKTALQKGEQSILAGITGTGKQDAAAKLDTTNSKLDTINQSILGLNTGGAGGSLSGLSSGGASAVGGSSTGGSWLSGAASVLGSLIPGGGMLSGLFGSMFGGHRALGGSVQAGMSYDVGEQGRETFVPKTDGSIVPNNRSGQQFITNVTTAGGMTPEQTKMMVQQAIRDAHPQFVASAVRQMHSTSQRQPSSQR